MWPKNVITQILQSLYNFISTLVGGITRGLVGVVTKPLGGAAELVAQTGQGLLGMVLNKMSISNKKLESLVTSITKEINFIIDCQGSRIDQGNWKEGRG